MVHWFVPINIPSHWYPPPDFRPLMLLRRLLVLLLTSLGVVLYHLLHTFGCHSNSRSIVISAGRCPAEADRPNTEYKMAHASPEIHELRSESVYAGSHFRVGLTDLLVLVYADPAQPDPRLICARLVRVLHRNLIRKHDWRVLSMRTLLSLKANWREWQFVTTSTHLRTLRCALFIEYVFVGRTVT